MDSRYIDQRCFYKGVIILGIIPHEFISVYKFSKINDGSFMEEKTLSFIFKWWKKLVFNILLFKKKKHSMC